ncbi:pickpocket protein 28-like isoform X2 [Sitodiplosis mosellana]|uniref:pickpocket protein 28-like isoform X2 n=1 Tax=Sitodiplosis mosellana TaxID=263140 RepID=UPI002443EB69|nr:pickpocket protein 28-like isoform X2 [Sitodiplosis mosellana]
MLMHRRKNQRPNIFRIKMKHPNVIAVPGVNQQNEAAKTRIAGVWSEFCTHSSIHCISYFVDRKRHWIERVWWICAFLLLVCLCINSIFSVWWRWRENLVIISLSHKPMSIGEVPFPAMTICPETKTCARIFNYTDVYRSMFKLDGAKSRNISDEELQLMKIINQICEESRQERVFKFFTDEYSDPNILSTISRMAPKFEDTVVRCRLFDEWKSCDKFLYPTITEEGLCYSFNALSMEEIFTNEFAPDFFDISRNQSFSNWNMEFGYSLQPKDIEPYPIRVYGTGKQSSFTVLLRIHNEDIDHVCGGAIQGFKLTFHPPHEGPQISKRYYHVSPGRTMLFTISPNLILTSPDVRKYSPQVRGCFFDSERRLRFYKMYTQRNCEMECLSNFTLAQCGCVEFSMPPDYDLVSFYSKSSYQPNFSFHDSTFSRVVISFKEELFTPSRRLEYYNFSNFLANSGGLFGLFMGASLLSFIELIYYFTLRVFFTRRKQKRIHDADSNTSLSLKKQNKKMELLKKRLAIPSY